MVASNGFPVAKCESVKGAYAARVAISRQEAIYDTSLVTRFKSGDESAFNEIAVRHRSRLFAIAFGVLKNHSDAEEVVQDALIRAHRGLAAFRGDSSLLTWLRCIAVNLARNQYWYYRRRCRHVTIPLDCPLYDDRQGSCSDLVATEESNPARQVVNREFSEVVAGCMALLGGQQQEILILRLSLERSYDEIAKELDISVGTVKSRLGRARETLRKLFAHACPEFRRGTKLATWFETVRPTAVVR